MQSENTSNESGAQGSKNIVDRILHTDPALAENGFSISCVRRYFDKVTATGNHMVWVGQMAKDCPIITKGMGANAPIAARKLGCLIYYGWLPPGWVKPNCGVVRCMNPEHWKFRRGLVPPSIDWERAKALQAIDPDQDPTLPPGFSRSFKARFWEKVSKRGPGECWPWLGATDSHGYGSIGRGINQAGNIIRAHVASWIIHNGPVPEGMEVCHHCPTPNPDNRWCTNPAHLACETHAKNMEDAKNKRRDALQAHWNAKKLTVDDVIEIRRLYHERVASIDIAERFGIDPSYVSDIVHGHRWNRPGCW